MNIISLSKVFFSNILKENKIILSLSIRTFQMRYINTTAGFIWSIIQPLAAILIFWLVFGLGFKATGPNNIPFILYYLPGFLIWTLFNDAVIGSTNTLVSNVHLVKKMVFPTEILVCVEFIVASFNHLILLFFTTLLLLFYDIFPSIYIFQLIYFYFATSLLIFGLGLFLSSINAYYKDMGQFIGIFLSFYFWLTPIVWSIDLVPKEWQFLLKINPIYYLVEGYRDAIIYHNFNYDFNGLIYFWIFTILIYTLGISVFFKLKPGFADVI